MKRDDIVALRCAFLRKMCTLREQHDTRSVVYLDETWINHNHSRTHIWQNDENTTDFKVPTGKGGRIQYIFGLVFLNPVEVSNCFVEYLIFDCPVNTKLTNYCDYLTDTYISEDCLFPPSIWASNTSELIRTTNVRPRAL